MNESTAKTPGAWRAVLFLFVIATVIPEVLIGSTPLSRLNQLVLQFPLYGSAALVVRELVVRFRLGRAGLLALGLAFGITIEGLALQSLFNPHFLNFDITFGRAAEVNWPWALYMVGYHALWSITVPITLTELVFPSRAVQSWLGKFGTGAFLVLLALMIIAFHAIFVKMSGFSAPITLYVGALLAITLLVVLGLQLKHRERAPLAPAPSLYLPGILSFLFGLAWLGLYGVIFHHPYVMSAGVNLAAGLVLGAVFFAWNDRNARTAWSRLHWLSFVTGALAANTLFGFVVLSGSRLDTGGQMGVAVIVAAGLIALARKLNAPPLVRP